MKIFFLDKRPDDAAEMHCDKHCVKMILEYAQMLSTAHRILDEDLVHPDLYNMPETSSSSSLCAVDNIWPYSSIIFTQCLSQCISAA